LRKPVSKLTKEARARNLSPSIVRNRIRSGWSKERALSTPNFGFWYPRKGTVSEAARAVGLKPTVVLQRIRRGQKLTQSLYPLHLNSHQIIQKLIGVKCRKLDISPALFWLRVKKGASVEGALVPRKTRRSYRHLPRAPGLSMSGVYKRLAAGWSLAKAMSTPPAPKGWGRVYLRYSDIAIPQKASHRYNHIVTI